MEEEKLICQVCEKNEALGVASSVLGPASFAYCRECLAQHAEPLFMCEATIEMAGGCDGLAEWAKRLTTYRDGKYMPITELSAAP